MSVSLRFWRVATQVAAPALPIYLKYRVRLGKEIATRLPERYGISSKQRPAGTLIWLHAASMGETMSALPLIEVLSASTHVLLTTGTTTSATLAAARATAIHQFMPLDTPNFCNRFLEFWRPNAAVFVESEIWPNCLAGLDARRIPRVLINARLSARSAARWARLPDATQILFGGFSWIAAQSEKDAQALRHLGLSRVETPGNLKFAAQPLPDNLNAREEIQAACPGPRFLAASTHDGEEIPIVAAHRTLRASFPELLTIIAPRHPERAHAIAEIARDLNPTRRSLGQVPSPGTIHIADTLGELGLFYRLCPVVFIGGSLMPVGGHNMIEAAQLGCAMITGRHVDNFKEIASLLQREGALLEVSDTSVLASLIADLLHDRNRRDAMASAAQQAVRRFVELPEQLAARILDLVR